MVLVMSFFPVDEGDDGVLAVVGVLEVFPASFSPCVERGLSGRDSAFSFGACVVTNFDASSVPFSDRVIAAVVSVAIRGPLK